MVLLVGLLAASCTARQTSQVKHDQVGRITTAGVITRIPLPTASAAPTDICTGPDAKLWITEEAAGKIARLDPTTVAATTTGTTTSATGGTTAPAPLPASGSGRSCGMGSGALAILAMVLMLGRLRSRR